MYTVQEIVTNQRVQVHAVLSLRPYSDTSLTVTGKSKETVARIYREYNSVVECIELGVGLTGEQAGDIYHDAPRVLQSITEDGPVSNREVGFA